MPVHVSSREPQLKPHCPASDLCSDKLEHILLRKDVILLLVPILVLVSWWKFVWCGTAFIQSDSEKGLLRVSFPYCYTARKVWPRWPVLLFGFFDTFYMMFKKVLNWQDAGRYMAIEVRTFHFRVADVSLISNICTGPTQCFSRQHWTN